MLRKQTVGCFILSKQTRRRLQLIHKRIKNHRERWRNTRVSTCCVLTSRVRHVTRSIPYRGFDEWKRKVRFCQSIFKLFQTNKKTLGMRGGVRGMKQVLDAAWTCLSEYARCAIIGNTGCHADDAHAPGVVTCARGDEMHVENCIIKVKSSELCQYLISMWIICHNITGTRPLICSCCCHGRN